MKIEKLRDDFETRSSSWSWRCDGSSRIEVENSVLRLCMGPTEALYYSNAEISDGGFDSLKWSSGDLIIKARFCGEGFPHFGSAGFGFWNYTMRIDLCYPIWFIYLRSVSPRYPLQGFFIQVGNAFLPITLYRSVSAYKLISSLLPFASPIRILSSKPVLPDIDLRKWHEYGISWKKGKVVFLVDNDVIAEIPVTYNGKARIDVWIDNAVFQPIRNDPARVYRHVTHENRAEACLEIDWIECNGTTQP